MIVIEKLTKKFGDTVAVQIDDLQIHPSEIVGLVGNNGAGKTTLFRLMLDLYQTDSGKVLSNGLDVSKTEDWKWYTGSYIDSGFLVEFFTPEEYFHFIGRCHNMSKNQVADSLSEFEKFMGGEILGKKKYIQSFSMGNKQKIGIIGAMMIHPKMLILDEPFNFLDPSSQLEMRHLLLDFNEKYGITMFLSSHNLEHITEVSSRILLLEKGNLIYDIKNENGEADDTLRTYFNK